MSLEYSITFQVKQKNGSTLYGTLNAAITGPDALARATDVALKLENESVRVRVVCTRKDFVGLKSDEVRPRCHENLNEGTKHAALLEAVNRPVSGDEVLKACETYNEWFAVPSDQACESALHATLEAHMAALREEVGK